MVRAAQEGTVCRRRQARRGSAVVEFALMLPVLLTLTLLCVDFGRFAHYYIAVTNAARAGAACGTVNATTNLPSAAWVALVQHAVKDELNWDTWEPDEQAKVTIATPILTRNSTNGDWWVQVDVTYSFQTLIGFNFHVLFPTAGEGPDYNAPLPLHGRVVMRGTI